MGDQFEFPSWKFVYSEEWKKFPEPKCEDVALNRSRYRKLSPTSAYKVHVMLASPSQNAQLYFLYKLRVWRNLTVTDLQQSTCITVKIAQRPALCNTVLPETFQTKGVNERANGTDPTHLTTLCWVFRL